LPLSWAAMPSSAAAISEPVIEGLCVIWFLQCDKFHHRQRKASGAFRRPFGEGAPIASVSVSRPTWSPIRDPAASCGRVCRRSADKASEQTLRK
jgi:hypothetical protein